MEEGVPLVYCMFCGKQFTRGNHSPRRQYCTLSCLTQYKLRKGRRHSMQELYNCKQIDSKHYKITKFDRDLNPKRDHTGRTSSYVVSELGCDCPQGHAKSCRHRKMLPFFLEHEHVNSEYFFVWDTHQWYRAPGLSGPTTTDEHWHVPAYGPGIIQEVADNGGGEQSPVSAAPSPQPSPLAPGDYEVVLETRPKAYRRF